MAGRTPSIGVMFERLTGKIDSIIDSQDAFKHEINAINSKIDAMNKGMEDLRAEDKRIDNRLTLTVSVSKAYMAGWASAFTALGACIASVAAYIFKGHV